MPELNDHELLAEFAETNSETAFAALVERYVNLVHSTALRFTGHPHHAEEITQIVFIILARKAGTLASRVVLSGWLYQAARLTAANFLKSEHRRQLREQEVFMQSTSSESNQTSWNEIAPWLDEAMGNLGETDRNAVVLRFFENKTAAEVAAKLKLTEAAAHKRVNRALEKLRKFFMKRGVSSTTVIIAVAISSNSVQAAPLALAKSVTAVAIAKGAPASTSTLSLIKGALKIMAWTKAKTAIVVGVAAILTVGTTTLVVHHHYAGAQTDFPSSSWTNAGYADPPTAVLTTLWAIKQGDGEKIVDSFTPELQQQFQQMFAKQMQAEGKSFIEVLSQEAPKHFSQNTGIKILGQKTVFGDQIALRVYVPGEQREHTFFLKKIGNEWKVNDIQ